jgi:drug/metabolite transporter (DMT)-like permease
LTGRTQSETAAVAVLSLCTVAWGSTFFLTKGVVTRHDPMSVLTFRFATGALVLGLARPGNVLRLPRRTWASAAAVGAAYGAAQIPHYYGLQQTAASTAGFLVGTYVVFTPLLDLLIFRRRSSALTHVGVGLAVTGLAVLTLADGFGFTLGEWLCLLSAVLYALQIATMGRFSPPADLWGFTAVVMATITVILCVPALLRGIDVPRSPADWAVIAYLALVAGALAVGGQAWAQRRLSASHAAVIMAGEPLWAAVLAVLFTSETVTTRLLVGGALLLAANLLIAEERARSNREAATS